MFGITHPHTTRGLRVYFPWHTSSYPEADAADRHAELDAAREHVEELASPPFLPPLGERILAPVAAAELGEAEAQPGGPPPRRGGPARPVRQDAGWPIFVAVNLTEVGLLLQKEIMEEKIFNYIIAWLPP